MEPELTAATLDAYDALHAATTQGEWEWQHVGQPGDPAPDAQEGYLVGPRTLPLPDTVAFIPADGRFMAVAHNDWPRLVAAVRTLGAEREALGALLEQAEADNYHFLAALAARDAEVVALEAERDALRAELTEMTTARLEITYPPPARIGL